MSECTGCGHDALFYCSQCGKAAYCSEECQLKEWPAHAQLCQNNTADSNDSATAIIGAADEDGDEVIADSDGTKANADEDVSDADEDDDDANDDPVIPGKGDAIMQWIQVSLEPFTGTKTQIAVELDGFVQYGRSETVIVSAMGAARAATLTFNPATPGLVNVLSGAQENPQLVDTRLVAVPDKNALRLRFAAPPAKIRDYTTTASFTRNKKITAFFESGQGFLPAQFSSRVEATRARPLRLAVKENSSAQKTQYLRRVITLLLLHASGSQNVSNFVRLFIAPYTGTVGGLSWSWEVVSKAAVENPAVFTEDIENLVDQIDDWLARLGNVQ